MIDISMYYREPTLLNPIENKVWKFIIFLNKIWNKKLKGQWYQIQCSTFENCPKLRKTPSWAYLDTSLGAKLRLVSNYFWAQTLLQRVCVWFSPAPSHPPKLLVWEFLKDPNSNQVKIIHLMPFFCRMKNIRKIVSMSQ